MARTGCAFAAVTCLCCPARTHRDRQVLPAYGLQDLPIKTQNPSRGSKPNTMWLPITLGESLGRGHFYLAEIRTFLLCVDKQCCWDHGIVRDSSKPKPSSIPLRRAIGQNTHQQTKPCDSVDSKSNSCAKRRETGSHLQIVE